MSSRGGTFTKDEHKRMAKEYIDKYKPRLIVGSPMCAMFGALQNLTPWSEEKQHRWREDRKHLQFVGELYKQQVKEGRWFLHIHPASATSWSLKEITDVMDMKGVDVTAADRASGEEDQVHVEQPRDPVRVDAQMRRTTSSSATIGVARRTCGSVPGGLVPQKGPENQSDHGKGNATGRGHFARGHVGHTK